ncbi:SDR family oxidoreductase [Opitutales bacterium ASA1]|uniref:SDR family NAD(P)-dependent oxidoreductase n=1 Tax=Congregicoccus parvus TaxID=3081749 RepID=UPI002B30B34F|nr:SDR family oxidoreductase [Opitutales bacterium ASA1]
MSTILITGAYRGLGFAAAKQLLRDGHTVVVTARELSKAERAAAELGARAHAVHLDVSDAVSVGVAAQEVARSVGSLDALINNAAVLLDGQTPLLELDPDVLRQTLDTNVVGALRAVQGLLPLLRKSKQPRIVNVSSGGGQFEGNSGGWAPTYCTSKSALNMLTVQLATALPDFCVNAVCPGWCRTEMGGAAADRSPEEGADTIAWLATESPFSDSGGFYRDRARIAW